MLPPELILYITRLLSLEDCGKLLVASTLEGPKSTPVLSNGGTLRECVNTRSDARTAMRSRGLDPQMVLSLMRRSMGHISGSRVVDFFYPGHGEGTDWVFNSVGSIQGFTDTVLTLESGGVRWRSIEDHVYRTMSFCDTCKRFVDSYLLVQDRGMEQAASESYACSRCNPVPDPDCVDMKGIITSTGDTVVARYTRRNEDDDVYSAMISGLCRIPSARSMCAFTYFCSFHMYAKENACNATVGAGRPTVRLLGDSNSLVVGMHCPTPGAYDYSAMSPGEEVARMSQFIKCYSWVESDGSRIGMGNFALRAYLSNSACAEASNCNALAMVNYNPGSSSFVCLSSEQCASLIMGRFGVRL